MDIKGKAISHRGHVRSTNEDHLLIGKDVFNEGERDFSFTGGQTAILLAVADGLGGHNAGEVASRIVLEDLSAHLGVIKNELPVAYFENYLNTWIREINHVLKDEGHRQQNLRGMGTTLAGVFFNSEDIYVFNVGDSRVYVYHDGHLEQITKDHTVPGADGSRTHILTNCIGASISPFVDTYNLKDNFFLGDILFICSDGVTDMLSDDQLAECIARKALDCMLTQALESGGKDNISFIIVERIR
jgi:PPM family protein phosphatase